MMLCVKCNMVVDVHGNGIEIYPDHRRSNLPSDGVEAALVCCLCAIGSMVPVIRPSNSAWEFGVLEELDDETSSSSEHQLKEREKVANRYRLRFMDDECEWVTVKRRVYAQYIAFHNDPSKTRSPSKNSPLAKYALSIAEKQGKESGGDYGTVVETRNVEDSRREDPRTPSPMSPKESSSRGRYKENSPQSDSSISLLSERLSPPEHKTTSNQSPDSMLAKKKRQPKYLQRLWSPHEDDVLLRAIGARYSTNLRWSDVAKLVPGRTGKQCRERYLNHLTPNIKQTDWSPVEDAVIFQVYSQEGSKWSLMSRLLRGRSDNGIKNRYHHLKRRMQRQLQITPYNETMKLFIQKLKQEAPFAGAYEDWILRYVASTVCLPRPRKALSEAKKNDNQGEIEICERCALLVPSSQTGRFICKTTGWCEECIRVSPCVPREILRLSRIVQKPVLTQL